MDSTCVSGGAAGNLVGAALQFFAASQCLIGEPWPQQVNLANESKVDFIVVGAGTAGAALAARLSELPVSVLLLEAGGDPPLESVIPYFKDVMKGSEYDWNFTTVNDFYSSQALIDGSQRQPRGKMLGGSGSLNDMVYARGFPADYDEWASIVGDEWSWKNVLEYFKKTEKLTDKNIIHNTELAALHGFDGEIEVSGPEQSALSTKKFLEAFEQLQFKLVDDMTNPYEIGAGEFSLTIKDGKRDSSLTALLNQASLRDNLFIFKNAQVLKILTENGITYGVKVLIEGDEMNFYADREVIVSAGTFNTAKLLLLSGIGPKEHLNELGIDLVSDLPVGENLHDHTMVLTYIAADAGTCDSNEKELYFNTIKYLYDQSGTLSRTPALAAYVSFKGSKNVPDFAFYPSCISRRSNFYESCVDILGLEYSICEKINAENQDKEILSIAVVNLKPSSRGRVKLKSNDPLDSPLIYSGTFSNCDDLVCYPEALDIAWSLVNTTYFKDKNAYVLDLGIEECRDKTDEDSRICIARTSAMSAWHAVGTAAMGKVVDSNLRVYGVMGLRVVDASVMPKIVRGNTNAPVVMIAEKAFNFITREHNFI